jgi:hypothetical protein
MPQVKYRPDRLLATLKLVVGEARKAAQSDVTIPVDALAAVVELAESSAVRTIPTAPRVPPQ